jgi:hypothetical protein
VAEQHQHRVAAWSPRVNSCVDRVNFERRGQAAERQRVNEGVLLSKFACYMWASKFACYMWEGYRRHTGPELDTRGMRGSKPAGFGA